MRVLITGATGFVGSALTHHLVSDGRLAIRAAVRRESDAGPEGVERVVVGDLTADTDWQAALSGVEAVVHLAGRAHVVDDAAADPIQEFRQVNVTAALELARQAAAAGVRRLVFLSSVKVNGEHGIYTEADPPAPANAYGISKHEAEQGLRRVALESGMEVVIIRSPLIYGPGAKANFRALMRAVARGIPLPLGAIHNRRSLVALDNLLDFIHMSLEHPAAVNQTFLISDGEDLSTTDLIKRLAVAMGRTARLIPVPAAVLMVAANLLRQRDLADRLLGSLQVDISKARRVLGWAPPISVDQGLRRAVGSSR